MIRWVVSSLTSLEVKTSILTRDLMSHGVRESPPPTPREAYLPQRPERMHKREVSELRLT